VLCFLVAGFAEIYGRFFLKLCDPVLYTRDSDIGNLLIPSQTCGRLGKQVHINAYSMRSGDFAVHKQKTNELRIMFIGDSVIYGGSRTDQKLLGTELVKLELPQKLNRPVEVGNISCNGWGPLNEWPYVHKYGLFDANYVIIELRSGSIQQTYLSIAGIPDFPEHKPYFATWEALVRYLPKVIPLKGMRNSNEGYHAPVEDLAVFQNNSEAINRILAQVKQTKAIPLIVLHWIRPEIIQANSEFGWQPKGMLDIKQLADRGNVAVLDMKDVESKNVSAIYRDDYHLNDVGQRILADIVETNIISHEALEK
jgi:hypothetical protein